MIEDPARHEKVRILMSKLDIRTILSSYDLEIESEVESRKGGTELVCVCPFHSTTSATFYLNDENGKFFCRSAFCGVKGDIVRFVSLKESCPDSMAFEILCETADISLEDLDVLNLTMGMLSDINQERPPSKIKLEPLELPEGYQEMIHPYFIKERGISPKVLRDAGAGAVFKNPFYRFRACVPVILEGDVYSLYSRAVGSEASWIRQHPDKADQIHKFFPRHHYSGNSLMTHLLYGVDYVRGDTVILVEAILSVLKLRTLGFHNAIAMMKAGISQEQAKLLIKKGFSRVLICADNDYKIDVETGKRYNPGMKASWNVYRKIRDHFETGILRLPMNVDPADMCERDQFDEILDEVMWPQTRTMAREHIHDFLTI